MSKGVYLGSNGSVEIGRSGLNVPLSSELDSADVNIPLRRFSFDFDSGALITGDRIGIYTEDKSNLELVANHAFPDWAGYINIDDAGGIRLFADFEKAINGFESEALELIAPATPQMILVRTQDSLYRFVSQVETYEFTTNRNTIDLSSIGDEFQRQYASGLISGQGTINCFWEYERKLCESDCSGQFELPQYFAELVLRLQQGSSFEGKFHLFTDPEKSVWWECPICIVTGVAMSFEPTQPIRTRIDFVTSGEIRMRVGQAEGYLLQEDADPILQEDGALIALEDD